MWKGNHLYNEGNFSKALGIYDDLLKHFPGTPLRDEVLQMEAQSFAKMGRLEDAEKTYRSMLKEGDVFFKEKAGYAAFAGGEHVEFIEKNGTLNEIEFQKGDRFYRCQGFKSRESCQCVR